jgi:hypothetical protein
MARSRGGDWLDEMRGLREHGVHVLVCALTAAEMAELDLTGEPDAARRAGLEFVALPVGDRSVPDRAVAVPMLTAIAARVRSGQHVVTQLPARYRPRLDARRRCSRARRRRPGRGLAPAQPRPWPAGAGNRRATRRDRRPAQRPLSQCTPTGAQGTPRSRGEWLAFEDLAGVPAHMIFVR